MDQHCFKHFDREQVKAIRAKLTQHATRVESEKIIDWLREDPSRCDRYSLNAAGLTLDFSRARACDETLALLLELAEAAGLSQAIEDQFQGLIVNHTEQRAVLHTALRSSDETPLEVNGIDIRQEIRKALNQVEAFTKAVHSGAWTGFSGKRIRDVVSIGIGGSYLGPRVVVEALPVDHHPDLNCHFASNVDAADLLGTLSHLKAEETLFIIQSKSFKTQETLTNAGTAKAWFLQNGGSAEQIRKHFVAVSSQIDAAVDFGIAEENVFPMWDWVGGRYSLWSAIGLPIALQIGMEKFRELLRGAEAMDQHFRATPLGENLPVMLGLLGLWYQDFLGAESCVILPYDQGLEALPAHLQQVDMESNGKGVDRRGQPLDWPSGALVWGGAGTNGQHAYHQLLHQGTRWIPADFILPLRSRQPCGRHHAMLVSNCLAQSQALLLGKSHTQALEELRGTGLDETTAQSLAPHKVIPGNRPSHLVVMDELNPFTLGALIALYEHKVMVQGTLWDINSYDQWGVELGKQLSDRLLPSLEGNAPIDEQLDAPTRRMIERFREAQPSS